MDHHPKPQLRLASQREGGSVGGERHGTLHAIQCLTTAPCGRYLCSVCSLCCAQLPHVAAGVDDLHSPSNKLGQTSSLSERGFPPSQHDILTGSNADGTLAAGDATCGNWSSTRGKAMVGHSNKAGSCCGDSAQSWNSAHLSEGCTLSALQAMGGAALFYCFAAE